MDPSALPIPPFVPPRVLRSGHLQTIFAPAWPAGVGDRGERVEIPIAGGRLFGRLHRRRAAASRGAVLILHGIVGTADEGFTLRTARLAVLRGLDALRISMRGGGDSRDCGSVPLYHAGLTDDVLAAIDWLGARYERVHLVGFSLGGHLVLRTVGELGARSGPVASATAISPPIDLAHCARFAERPEAVVYRRYIVRLLKERYHDVRAALAEHRHDAAAIAAIRTIRDFDAAIIAPLFGFRDVDDYYARAAAAEVFERIEVPTLILHAADDPLVPPWEPRCALPASVRLVVTERGGHVGFFAAAPAPFDRTRFWAEERAIAFARACE